MALHAIFIRYSPSWEKNSERYDGSSVYDHNLNPGLSDAGICIIPLFCLRGAPWD